MDHDSASQLLGAFALDACDDTETAEVTAHLHGCLICQNEMAEIKRASGWLGVSEIASPPTWLRAEILREAAKDTTRTVDRRAGRGDRRAAEADHPPAE